MIEAAHLVPGQFSRVLRAEIGQSPAKAVEKLRLEPTRLMMEQSRSSLCKRVSPIATTCAARFCVPMDSRRR
jgi:transcriptional regulator GlxA family with amidase domain